MTDIQKALLGDREAQERVTERGELLPCPCCGGEAVFHTRERMMHGEKLGWIFEIMCKKCNFAMAGKPCELSLVLGRNCEICFVKDERNDAMERWNHRPALLKPEQIKRLEEMENE